MEITEIQKAHAVKSVQAKTEVKSVTQIVDGVSISSEAHKMARWVEMLKEMPDIRTDKVPESSLPSDINLKIAEKILTTEI